MSNSKLSDYGHLNYKHQNDWNIKLFDVPNDEQQKEMTRYFMNVQTVLSATFEC